MKEQEVNANTALVNLSRHELVILGKALNEICHGVKIPGFSVRIGATREEALTLLRQIGKIIGDMDDLSPDRQRSQVIVQNLGRKRGKGRKRIE